MARRPGDAMRSGSTPGARRHDDHRIAGIEALRGLAATSIVICHAWLYSSPDGGRVPLGPLGRAIPDLAYGVTLFFALSGFLLWRPFAAALVRGESPPSIAKYFRNRALRILPAYWVILVLATVVMRSVLVRDAAGLHNGSGLDVGAFAANLLLIQNYVPSTLGTGIGPAWSLAVEVVFYLLLPALFLAAWRGARDLTSLGARRLVALAPAGALLFVGLSGKAVAGLVLPPIGPNAGYDSDWHSVVERSF